MDGLRLNFFFFFSSRRRHTRLQGDWSSDVCSSDLYYADITAAIDAIGAPVLLVGHSTGGLVGSLYAHEGARRGEVKALWLNSPFFDWRLPEWRRVQLHQIGRAHV